MKKSISLLFLMVLAVVNTNFAQSNFINYQGVASTADGVMQNQNITVKLDLKFGTDTATPSYTETHNITTDANGVFSLQIGNGAVDFGVFNELTWGSQNAFITTSIDGTEIGTTEMHAVPFSLNAGNSAKKIDDLEDAKTDGSSLFLGKDSGINDDNTFNINTAIGYNTLKQNSTGYANTALGYSALTSNANGFNNTAIGSVASGSNTTGANNTAIGASAMQNNSTGSSNTSVGSSSLSSNTEGSFNTANGNGSLQNNITGSNNSAVGFTSLSSNTTGYLNVAVGAAALRSNTGGFDNTALGTTSLNKNTNGNNNTASGKNALFSNIIGHFNTANGSQSLFSNTTGSNNIAIGGFSLYSNTVANDNIAMGYLSLGENTTGENNIAIGTYALSNNISGRRHIAIGLLSLSDFQGTGFDNIGYGNSSLSTLVSGSNNIGIGAFAQVPDTNGSNQVRIGSTNITYAGIQVAWTVTSDIRWKDKIRQLPYGLNMVKQLEPVDYIRKNNDKKTREIGFIAQDVEKVLIDLKYTDQGFLTKDDKGYISLRYNDLIPVLTKAIQEQQEMIEDLQKTNMHQYDLLKDQDTKYESLLSKMEAIENKFSDHSVVYKN